MEIAISMAEIERLWSITDYYFDYARNKIVPVLFESLIYLRANKDYWEEN